MQYSTLIAQIEADIYSNGAELITGDILQTVLKRMVSAWASAGAAYGGTISPDTVVPLSLDQATVYLALTAGTYEHFLDGEGDPIETTGPALVIYDGGPALIFSKTDLPSGGSGATVITVNQGDSLFVTIPKGDEGIKASYRIDMTAAVFGGDDDARYIGSLIIECNELAAQTAHGYYYGDDMDEILSEVAIWKDDPEFYPDEQGFYLLLTMQSDLNEVIFSVSSLDGQTVDADAANKDEKVKVSDAIISPVGSGGGVFWCVYSSSGTGTTAAEIDAAVAAGLAVKCRYDNNDYDLSYHDPAGSVIYFGNIYEDTSIYLMCRRSNNVWSSGILTLERTSNKVSTISGNETNTIKYPNTKAVADAIGKMGVISQTQTWSGTGSNPRTYVMSDQVTGLIPQANIDLFVSAGATFNDVTGYFELNGLTDISYEEMKAVYNRTIGVSPFNVTRTNMLASLPVRTQIPMRGIESYGVSAAYCYYNSDIEVAAIDGTMSITTTSGANYIFQYARKLRAIVGVLKMSMSSAPTNPFVGCGSLQELSLSGLATNLNLSVSPNLTAASVAYMITNAGTATITITLHATAYARAIADASVQAALAAHTNVSLASA